MTELKCPWCKHKLKPRVLDIISYSKTDKDVDIDHELRANAKGDKNNIIFVCSNCSFMRNA